jgi:predicted amidohydrolase
MDKSKSTDIIGVAQISVVKGDYDQNIAIHCKMIEQAAKHKVNILLFPELSLTGYELSLANELAISETDSRLQKLQLFANKYDMTLLVGAPKKISGDKPQIGLFVISPNKSVFCYSKMYLHENENHFFTVGDKDFYIQRDFGLKIGLAICADTSVKEHPALAAKQGINCYLASMLISHGGYEADSAQLRDYANKYNMMVAMANHSGITGGWACAGKSTIWDNKGQPIAAVDDAEFALVIAYQQEDSTWKGESIVLYKN